MVFMCLTLNLREHYVMYFPLILERKIDHDNVTRAASRQGFLWCKFLCNAISHTKNWSMLDRRKSIKR